MARFVRIVSAVLILSWITSGAGLQLKRREIRPDGRHPVRIEPAGPRWTADRSHLMLEFRGPLSRERIGQLNERDAFVVGTISGSAVAVSVRDGFSLEGLDVVWAGRFEGKDKISPQLDRPNGPGRRWFVAEFFPDVDMREARRLVEAAGLRVHSHADLLPTHLLLSGSADRLEGLVQWDEVAYVFPASDELIRGVRVRPCVGALTLAGPAPMYAVSGTGWPKDSSGQAALNYVFGPLTAKLPSDQVRQELIRALNTWSAYARLKFTPGNSATATRTVALGFYSKDHQDGFPFDGPSGALAHTLYPAPPNPEPIAGDMHLDGDEDWHIGTNTDLYTVAVHEAGHALGLAHVDVPSSIMYPYYRLGAKLSADDIAGIQSLYGAPDGSPTPVTTSPLTLTIASPAPNTSTVLAGIAVNGTTSGAAASVRVTWQTDHGSSGTAAGTTSWSVASIPLTAGSNTITITATDGSRSTVKTVSVTRTAVVLTDRTPPTLTISSPTSNLLTTTKAALDVKGMAQDASGISKVTWQSPAGSGTATGTSAWMVTIPLVMGDNNIIVRAYDTAGNASWRSMLVIRN